MKLLFDENLSSRLAGRLSDLFPESTQVSLIELEGYPDRTIWERAKAENYTIVSKDNDFRQLAFLFGMPPKVIWLQIGNAGTDTVESLIRRESRRIQFFQNDTEEALLILKL